MKVLLKEDVDNLGYAGEVHEVKSGFGRNFLIPQGLAVKATPGAMKQAQAWRSKAEARREQLRAEYSALADRIAAAKLTFVAKAGDTGKLYGSITTHQIADMLNEQLGVEIDRRKVGTEALRQLGKHKVPVRLSAEFQPDVTVIIESEDGTGMDAIVTDDDIEEVDIVEDVVDEFEEEDEEIVEVELD